MAKENKKKKIINESAVMIVATVLILALIAGFVALIITHFSPVSSSDATSEITDSDTFTGEAGEASSSSPVIVCLSYQKV